MGTKLSEKLAELKFFPVLDTVEGVTGLHQDTVARKTPFTFDMNNGTVVVYDEEGNPWIARSKYVASIAKEFETLEHEFPQLARGAYVPHSNDGGHFVREVMPRLQYSQNKSKILTFLKEALKKGPGADEGIAAFTDRITQELRAIGAEFRDVWVRGDFADIEVSLSDRSLVYSTD